MKAIIVLACLFGAALALSAPALGNLEPEFLETEGADVVYPRKQDICCKQGNDAARKACAQERVKAPNMTYWSLCVGATGYGCEGVSKEFTFFKDKYKLKIDVVKQHPYNAAKPSPHGVTPNPSTSMVGLFASIGAIMHDRCCTKYNDGTFCNSNNTPFISTLNVDLAFPPGDRLNNNCACLLEWRRAVFDLFNNYGEVMNFPRSPQPKLNAPGSVNRKTSLPGALTVIPLFRGSQWDRYYDQGITETVGTNAIKFSPGTKLTCIASVDPRCNVKPGAKLTPAQEVAGDASFCKSGKFAKIEFSTKDHGVGTCA